MAARARAFRELVGRRRSVRVFSDEPVARALIEEAVAASSTAPSGAHKQPWHFVAVADPAVEHEIRRRRAGGAQELPREPHERRMQEALAPLGTDHHREFLDMGRASVTTELRAFYRRERPVRNRPIT